MKTETQIAKEKIKIWKEVEKPEYLANIMAHKATCQRFLEFLEEHKIEIGLAYGDSATVSQSPDWLKEKIIDLEQAIKLYEDAGV